MDEDLRYLGALLADDRSNSSNKSEKDPGKLYFGPTGNSTHDAGDGYPSDGNGDRPFKTRQRGPPLQNQ
ncbi:hypothetical protein THAOC_11277, partial [Thalassiosira oceanica]